MSMTKAREMMVLSTICAHPVHGYEIAAAFESGALQLAGLKRPAVYSILNRFVERGWIVEREEQAGSYPDRRVCHPTEKGLAALSELSRTSGGLPQLPLMALMFIHDAGLDVSDNAAAQFALRKKLLSELKEAGDVHADTFTHQMAIAVLLAEIEVLGRLLKAEVKR